MKRSLLVAVVAGACVVGPAVAQAAPRSGVVVDYGANSHTATVATKSGKLIAVHPSAASEQAPLTQLPWASQLAPRRV